MNNEITIPVIKNMPDLSKTDIKEILLTPDPFGKTGSIDKNRHKIEELTTEYVSNILSPGKEEFSGEKYKKIEDDKLEEMNKTMDNYLLVREKIREKHPGGNQFIKDTIPCPICKDGIVSFIISDHYNGHIHAKCSNGCVNWME